MYYGLLCALLKHSALASVGMMRMRWLEHCSVLKRQFCILGFKGGKPSVTFNEAEGKNSCPWKLFLQGHTFLVPHLPPVWNSQKPNARWRRIVTPLKQSRCKTMLKEVEEFLVVLWVTDPGLSKSVSLTLPAESDCQPKKRLASASR